MTEYKYSYIDYAKAAGILLVVYGHVIIFAKHPSYADVAAKNMIYAFHMPLFFVISGLLLRNRQEKKQETELVRELSVITRRLLLPYLIWSLIYIGFRLWDRGPLPGPVLRKYAFVILTGRGMAPLWFFFDLWAGEGILLCLSARLPLRGKQGRSRRLLLLAASALLSLLFQEGFVRLPADQMTYWQYYLIISLFRLAPTVFFLLTGSLLWDIYHGTVRREPGKPAVRAAAALLLIAAACAAEMRYGTGTHMNLHLFQIASMRRYLLTGLAGALGVLELCRCLPEHLPALQQAGRHTAGVMVVHYPPVPLFHFVWASMVRFGCGEQYVRMAVILFALSLLLTMAGARVYSFGRDKIIGNHTKKNRR